MTEHNQDERYRITTWKTLPDTYTNFYYIQQNLVGGERGPVNFTQEVPPTLQCEPQNHTSKHRSPKLTSFLPCPTKS